MHAGNLRGVSHSMLTNLGGWLTIPTLRVSKLRLREVTYPQVKRKLTEQGFEPGSCRVQRLLRENGCLLSSICQTDQKVTWLYSKKLLISFLQLVACERVGPIVASEVFIIVRLPPV